MADYDSNFDSEDEVQKRNKRVHDLIEPESSCSKKSRSSAREEYELESSSEERRRQRKCFLTLDAYTRHKILINEYQLCYAGSTSKLKRDTSKDKTDLDVIRENHRFLWDDSDQELSNWGQRLAKKYYDKLFKEYGICDLSRFKENKIAMRWRTEKEVVEGKGQFVCGERKCTETAELRSWEVNFGYIEEEVKKNALVKMRLCRDCSYKLNYRNKKKEAESKKRRMRELKARESDSDEEASTSHNQPSDSDANDSDYNDCLDNLLL